MANLKEINDNFEKYYVEWSKKPITLSDDEIRNILHKYKIPMVYELNCAIREIIRDYEVLNGIN
jgi:hypothetical protein